MVAVAAVATGVVAAPVLLTALGLTTAIATMYANLSGLTLSDLSDSIRDIFNNAKAALPTRYDPLACNSSRMVSRTTSAKLRPCAYCLNASFIIVW